jgi:hypothetical protein
LRQILINLLGNAIKFTDRGSVFLRVTVLDKSIQGKYRIRFEVKDTGVGMTPKQLEKIFMPFEQVGDRQRMTEGTGLGLTISQKIVELIGSQIQVKSTLGEGSSFWFDVDVVTASEWLETKAHQTTQNIVGYEGQQSHAAGCNSFIPKPIQSEELLQQLGFHLCLSWILESETPACDPNAIEQSAIAFVFPSVQDLEILQQAARMGDIDTLEQEAQRLLQLDQRYKHFADQLLQLLQEMNEVAIVKFIQQAIAEVKS